MGSHTIHRPDRVVVRTGAHCATARWSEATDEYVIQVPHTDWPPPAPEVLPPAGDIVTVRWEPTYRNEHGDDDELVLTARWDPNQLEYLVMPT